MAEPIPIGERLTVGGVARVLNKVIEERNERDHLNERRFSDLSVTLNANTKAVTDLTTALTPVAARVEEWTKINRFVRRTILAGLAIIFTAGAGVVLTNWFGLQNRPPVVIAESPQAVAQRKQMAADVTAIKTAVGAQGASNQVGSAP